ncbi:very long-chain acyl-CoA synthetase isoform X2 [Fundulus heteroclitus]|uniref:very long-chain acyl-CoA synthetase isoform X2 n=1 Tax=Fundulus heteroclitus TaxID=8078 RepID=UPI00165C7EDB|nr:very long-chain acyl-CoA synthetase isoform X2 [Fundulus heteroclitus]
MEIYFISTILAGALILPLALKTCFPYLWTDLRHVGVFLRILFKYVAIRRRRPPFFALDRFLERSAALPDKPFIVFGDEAYTYADADRASNRIANALRSQRGYEAGVSAALFMGNEPGFLFTWLALAKLGSPVALLNYNIRSKSLLHCFNCCKAKVLIAAAELKEAVEDVLPSLMEQGVTVLLWAQRCDTPGIESFSDKVEAASDTALPPSLRSRVTLRSPAVYIYTSGTTGLPKAALVDQNRLLSALAVVSTYGVTSKDVVYVNLPLYHTAGFVVGFLGCIETGSTIVLKRKFSASQFWDDCRKYNVTVVQYIGEVMRYLCCTPKKLFPYILVKYDTERDEPIRDASGLCVEALKGETGLLVSKITDIAPFVGYAENEEQTERKKLRNVLKKGDLYFNTGDLMRIDKDNFIYFQDRVGDTFRWKGENVATTEVSDILSMSDCLQEANVYGVQVPGHEGRVGMAAATLKRDAQFDGSKLHDHVVSYLPSYARPRFIRLQSAVEVTGTFKQMKVKLVEQGFDPEQIQEPLYILDDRVSSYVPLTAEIYSSILSGHVKL